jgi:hypothetical protein
VCGWWCSSSEAGRPYICERSSWRGGSCTLWSGRVCRLHALLRRGDAWSARLRRSLDHPGGGFMNPSYVDSVGPLIFLGVFIRRAQVMSDSEESMDKCSRQVRRRKRRDRSRGRVFARVPCFRAERRFPRSLSLTRSKLSNINFTLCPKDCCHISMQTRPQSSSNCSGASLASPCITLDCGLRSNLPFIHSEGGAQSTSILLSLPS